MTERKAWFNCGKGERWDTAVTASTIRRVRAECDVQLLDLVDGKKNLLRQCYDDPVALFAILCAVVRPQLKDRGLTDDEFGDRLDSEAIAEAAVDALLDGVVGFFPGERRAILEKLLGKIRSARERVRATGLQTALAHLPELDRLMDEALANVPGG